MMLNFACRGQGDPVIVLHGLFGSLDNLGTVARALAERFSVYSLDLRNHGDSPHSAKMDYPTMAADIVAFMDRQNLARASLLGHSMGGKVAMQVALCHADRVNKLVVADIAPTAYPGNHDSVFAGLRALASATIGNRSQADRILAEFIAEAPVRAFLLKNLVANGAGGYRLRLNLPALENGYEQLRAAVTGTAFTGPTLFIKGADSPYIQEKHRPLIRHLFPNAHIVEMTHCGHWLHVENPALFNRQVLAFL